MHYCIQATVHACMHVCAVCMCVMCACGLIQCEHCCTYIIIAIVVACMLDCIAIQLHAIRCACTIFGDVNCYSVYASNAWPML